MSDWSINTLSNTKPLEMADFSDIFSSRLEVDTSEFENEIHRQNKTMYVAQTEQRNGMDFGPQLARPLVRMTGENDDASLKNILATLEETIQDGSVDTEALQSRLETITQGIKANQEQAEQSWEAFEQVYASLPAVQAKAEQVLRLLNNLEAQPTETDLENVSQIANAVFVRANVTLAALEESVEALVGPLGQQRLASLEKISLELDPLKVILVEIRQVMKVRDMVIMDEQNHLYTRQQNSLIDRLQKKADELKVAQNWKEALVQGLKYFAMALAIGLSTLSGLGAGLMTAAMTALFMGIDMGTGGALSEKVIMPMLTPVIKAVEGITKGISEVLKAMGCNEIAATLVAAVVAVAAMIAAVYVCAKASSKAVEFLVEKIGNVMAPIIQKIVGLIQGGLPKFAQFIKEAWQCFREKFLAVKDWMSNVVENYFPGGITAFVKIFEVFQSQAFVNFLKKVQNWTMALGVATEAGLTAAHSTLERNTQYLLADINLAQTDYERIGGLITKVAEDWIEQQSVVENFIQLAAQVEKSKVQALMFGYKKIAA